MKRKSRTIKISLGAMLTTLSIVLPQVFHLTGIPQVGAVFLPMHIPVLIAGFALGPVYGAVIGAIAPIASYFITGMPSAARLPFMLIELIFYGLSSGIFYHKLKLKDKKFGTIISLVLSMLTGRVAYAAALIIAGYVFGIEAGGIMAAVTATVTGVYGIVLQVITIPPVVYTIKKGGLLK